MTTWTEETAPATDWKGATAEPERRYGVGKYGVRAYGQGGTLTHSPFTEVVNGG